MKKLYIIFFLLGFIGCKNTTNETIQKVEVKQPQNVNAETLKILDGIYKNAIGDTLLPLNKDTLFTFRFFDKLINKQQLVFSDNGKLSTIGDSLLYILMITITR